MKIATAAAALFLATPPTSTSAGRVGSVRNKQIKLTSGNKPVRATHQMMRHAKQISGDDRHRQLQNGERDISFLYQYSITFDSCHSATTVKQEGQDNGDEFTHLIASNSIQFNLCPTSGGRRCGTYLAPMTEFLQAYFESQMDEQEYQCEMAQQQCEYEANYNQNYNGNGNGNNNGNYNEQYAMNQCFEEKGLDYCQEYEGQEEFEVERYVECAEWEGNGEYNTYYIGPYCADGGRSVKLGMFQDGGCAIPSTEALETFNKYSYMELPYVKESMVSKKVAISCMEQDRDANNNYYYQQQNNGNNNNANANYQNWNQDIQISPFCEELYERSARCEKGLRRDSTYYWSPDNEACDYINKVLPALDAAAFGGSANHTAAKVFAWIYGILTVGLAGYVFWLHQKKSRRVELSGMESISNVIS